MIMSSLQSLGRWLRLKQYQIEVTFGVYIFTPIEKFVFWSVVFLLFSLCIIATSLYLPQHIVFLLHRAWFYAYGDDTSAAAQTVLGGFAKDVMPPPTMTAAAAGGVVTSVAADVAVDATQSLARGEL